MKTKTKKISLRDRLKFLKAKQIQTDSSILENILGIPITLREFSGTWEEQGIFIKELGCDLEGYVEGYSFLSRHYADPAKNGRGNIIIVRGIAPDSVIVAKNESDYIIRVGHELGGGMMICDDMDIKPQNYMDVSLIEGFACYDLLLTRSGIPKIRKVN